ncbi:MAG: hypothetical protein LBU81_08365 [Methanosarcinales archaeon]|nr:hypothetical protein [Methanosarcinales archaeon]
MAAGAQLPFHFSVSAAGSPSFDRRCAQAANTPLRVPLLCASRRNSKKNKIAPYFTEIEKKQ